MAKIIIPIALLILLFYLFYNSWGWYGILELVILGAAVTILNAIIYFINKN